MGVRSIFCQVHGIAPSLMQYHRASADLTNNTGSALCSLKERLLWYASKSSSSRISKMQMLFLKNSFISTRWKQKNFFLLFPEVMFMNGQKKLRKENDEQECCVPMLILVPLTLYLFSKDLWTHYSEKVTCWRGGKSKLTDHRWDDIKGVKGKRVTWLICHINPL